MNDAEAFQTARRFLMEHREDYSGARKGFAWPRLERFNWALDWFDHYAAGNERTALRVIGEDGSEEKYSFARLSKRSSQVAHFLSERGVRRHDPVLLMLGNVAALWEIMLAAIKLGAVIVPATTLLAPDELRDRLQRGRIAHLIVDSAQTGKFVDFNSGLTRIAVGSDRQGWIPYQQAEQHDPEFRPPGVTRAQDPLLLYFTSGTTSRPKLVLHSHQSYPVGHLSTLYWIGLREGDVHMNISSPGWAKHAWSSFFAPWIAGATILAYRYQRFDAKKLLEVVSRSEVSTLCAPPTVWRLLIQEDLGAYPVKLREIVSAGEPLNPKVIEALQAAWGIIPRDGYGQTETTALVGNPPGQPVRAGSMGRPLPGYEVVLLDEYDRETGSEGEIALRLDPSRPLGLMQGYSKEDGRREAPRGRFYRTGDIARRDSDGYLTYIGRADDVFKSADYRISPFELESFIIKHQAIAEAAVVPSPHPTRLAVPKAYLALRPGAKAGAGLARDIFDYIGSRLSPFKRIRRIEFAALPKTVSGKIRRVELRQAELERAPGVRHPGEYWEEDFPESSATGPEPPEESR